MRANSILVTMALSMLLMAAFCEESLGKTFRPNTTATLKTAAKDAKSGDVILLANRTWNNLGVIDFRGSGVSIRSATKGRAKIKGNSFFRITGNNVVLKYLTFQDTKTPGRYGNKSAGTTVLLSGAIGSRVEENKFINCGSTFPILKLAGNCQGARVQRNDFIGSKRVTIDTTPSLGRDVRIERNHFLNIPFRVDGAEAVVLRGGNAVRVRWNYFQNCDGDEETVSVKSNGQNISFNYFHNNDLRGGVTLRTGNGSFVFGNYFHRCKEGVRIYGNNHYVYNNQMRECNYGVRIPGRRPTHVAASNCLVINNTIINSQYIGLQVGVSNSTALPGINKFYNNIIQQKRGIVIQEAKAGAMAKIIFQKNLVHKSGSAAWGATKSGIERHFPNLVQQGPIFRLSSNSYARHRGVKHGIVKVDIDGQGRGNSKDIGADEYTSPASRKVPVNGNNTGVRKW